MSQRPKDAEAPGDRPRRIFNFAAGPAVMPRPVLELARDEMLDWHGTGMSVWEMPFTGKDFKEIAAAARADLCELLEIPSNYKLLFLQGGASAQFSFVPMNLLAGRRSADYIETGHWARKAINEGRRYCTVNVAASGAGDGFTRLPPRESWRLTRDAAYCHITSNETANGVEYHSTPDTGEVPLVADMTSSFLSRSVEVSRYGLIYAGAQKNIGPAGLTVVIVREDLIGAARPETPSVFNYKVQADSGGRFNTPLTYAVYLAGLVFRWLKAQGGLPAMAEASRRKAAKLYAAIDDSDFYVCPVAPADRSRTNLCFAPIDRSLVAPFLTEAAAAGLINLAGHSAFGGMRASLYNAMPEEGVEALIDFMDDFARAHR